ncbi:hypothetical protein NL676_038532 [Syzygium grande]|nr:hypothetical protein NL676_038532 [Syzygium grande]
MACPSFNNYSANWLANIACGVVLEDEDEGRSSESEPTSSGNHRSGQLGGNYHEVGDDDFEFVSLVKEHDKVLINRTQIARHGPPSPLPISQNYINSRCLLLGAINGGISTPIPAFIAVKYRGEPNSPFDTHPLTSFLTHLHSPSLLLLVPFTCCSSTNF